MEASDIAQEVLIEEYNSSVNIRCFYLLAVAQYNFKIAKAAVKYLNEGCCSCISELKKQECSESMWNDLYNPFGVEVNRTTTDESIRSLTTSRFTIIDREQHD